MFNLTVNLIIKDEQIPEWAEWLAVDENGSVINHNGGEHE